MFGKCMARARVGSKPAGVAVGSDKAGPRFGVGSIPAGRQSIRNLNGSLTSTAAKGPNTNLKLGYIGPST